MVSSVRFLPLHDAPRRIGSARTAIVHGDTRWSGADLDRRARQWAFQLAEHGVQSDALVAFDLPNGPDYFALAFGIYKLGATPAPLSPKLTTSEFEDIVSIMKPAGVVSSRAIPGYAIAPPIDGAAEISWDQGCPVASSWKACTSGGSTGRPKVIVDGRSAGFPAGTEFIAIPELSSVLIPGPLYHNAPFSAAIFALWRGNKIVTMPRFDEVMALSLIEREKIEWSIMVPTMMRRIMTLLDKGDAAFDLRSWKTIVHTAAPIDDALKRGWIERFGADHIWEVYGATEGLVRTWIGGAEWLTRPGSVGKAIGGAQIKIITEDGAHAAPAEIGEIFAIPATGPGTSYRYIGADRRMRPGGWESVGDYGWLDEDGYLFLADRRADLIICGGVNIWPAEVENVLLSHPAIQSAAVIGLPDDDLGARVHAVIESNDPALSFDSLCDFLKDKLSRHKIPRSVTIVTEPVRDEAGKVRKSDLKQTILEGEHANF